MSPSKRDLAVARDEFRHLLASETQEAQWREFFSVRPYVLSLALPLRLEPQDIIPFARPGRTEPDFVFYPQHRTPIPYYGVIELKKPSTQIVSIPRKNVAILSRDAETAIQQATEYSEGIARYSPVLADNKHLFLGNRSHIFVVMGMELELSAKLANDLYRDMVEKRLPPNLQILPYDNLLANFESAIPRQVYVLIPYDSIARAHRTLDTKKLFVGNLPYSITPGALRELFEKVGTVIESVTAKDRDRETGLSKGFGFIEMSSLDETEAAIEMWNGRQLEGRSLTVNLYRPSEERPRRFDMFRR